MPKSVYDSQNKFEEIISRIRRAEDRGSEEWHGVKGARQRELLGAAFHRIAFLVMEFHYMAGYSDQDAARHMIEAAREAAELYLTTNEGE